MKQQPGVMIYFDMLPVLRMLTNEEKGILFQTMMEYAQTGEYNSLPERLAYLWPTVQYRLDQDQERYRITVIKRKYAAYARWEKQHQREPMAYTKWVDERRYVNYDDEMIAALA